MLVQMLIHILECIDRIEQYLKGGRKSFMSSIIIQDAVIRNLQTMAESTQRISDESKSKHPEIDWRGLAGFRNILVHNYLGIDLEHCWEIVEHNLPDFKGKIRKMLE